MFVFQKLPFYEIKDRSETNVLILKIFSPNNWNKMAILTQITAMY
jgi:hypothetical protein